jgi:hypothetical protein
MADKDPEPETDDDETGVLWNHIPHVNDPKHPEDKDWADSEPDPNAP